VKFHIKVFDNYLNFRAFSLKIPRQKKSYDKLLERGYFASAHAMATTLMISATRHGRSCELPTTCHEHYY
jgi:hypothetical protein